MNATVLLADDQSLIRTAVRALIEGSPDLTVVGEATNGQEALDQVRLLRPNVVLMDIRMPILDGIEATKQICNDPDLSEIRVLILTTFEEDEYIVEALRAGASGFIGKGTEPTALIQAIAAIHSGESLLSPVATRLLVDRYVRTAPPEARTRTTPVPGLDELTDREREVLLLVAAGLSNSEIAERLFISPSTAKTHVNRIMTKLYAHDRAQLVIAAYESGLV